ncbi:ABC transporter permease [Acidobacteria bacterium AH-259-O06]|nr:ABC transporter permease [Acidobacteria bacterium AH-259-O06]
MFRFVLRRILETIPLLFLISLLIFALFKLIPGDYLSEMELNPSIPRQRIEELRQEYGLKQPFYIQYFTWVGQVLQGNLGYSFAQQRSAVELILERLTNTVILTISALALTIIVSFPLGILTALNPGRGLDRLALFFSLIGLSLPSVLASLIFLFFAFRTGWFPIGGTGGLHHLVLPSLTLALPTIAFFVRNLRLEMIDTLRQPFVTAAAAKGLRPYRVVLHAFRNAVNPMISITGITFGGLLSGSVVVEKIFDWPGLGALVVDSILSRDLFVVLNCVLVSALLIVAANLLADLVLAWNDPRIRYQ